MSSIAAHLRRHEPTERPGRHAGEGDATMTRYLEAGATIPECARWQEAIGTAFIEEWVGQETFTMLRYSDSEPRPSGVARAINWSADGNLLIVWYGNGGITAEYPRERVARIERGLIEHEREHEWTVTDDDRGKSGVRQVMYCEACNTVRALTGPEYNAYLDAEITAGRAVADEIESD